MSNQNQTSKDFSRPKVNSTLETHFEDSGLRGVIEKVVSGEQFFWSQPSLESSHLQL